MNIQAVLSSKHQKATFNLTNVLALICLLSHTFCYTLHLSTTDTPHDTPQDTFSLDETGI